MKKDKLPSGKQSIAETHPHLVKHWDHEKNGELTPNDVTFGSGKCVWWLCERGHSWEARVSGRVKEPKPISCPYCKRKRVYIDDKKCILDRHFFGKSLEEIAEEFCLSKNTVYRILKEQGIVFSGKTSRRISKEDLNKMAEMYTDGISLQDLKQGFGYTAHYIGKALEKRTQISLRTQSEVSRKYPVNENYFETIDIPEKAYFLGLVFADGCVCGNHFSISLTEDDVSVLKKLSCSLYGWENLGYYSGYKTKTNGTTKSKYVVRVTSAKLISDLGKHGCVERKSLVLDPSNLNLPLDLIFPFILGYWDGDGWISIHQTRKFHTLQFAWGVAGTKVMLDWILAVMSKFTSINHLPRKKENIFSLVINDMAIIKEIMDLLYQRGGNVYLERKYLRYQRLLDWIEGRSHRHFHKNDTPIRCRQYEDLKIYLNSYCQFDNIEFGG